MASYTANYTNDFSKVFNRVNLNIYLINTALENESRTETTKTYDADFIPPVFQNLILDAPAICSITQGTRNIRQAIITLSETEKLFIPCPFIGGSNEFYEFFRHLVNLEKALVVELSPETLSSWYVEVYSGYNRF